MQSTSNLKKDTYSRLPNDALLFKIREKSKAERALSLEVIELIREVNTRKLFLKLGFGSLFDFVTQDLGYEASSAMRRIQAARIIQALPEVKDKIEKGALSLSVVAQAETFFRKEERRTGQKVNLPERKEILQKLENQSSRQAEKTLLTISPESVTYSEKKREISETHTELKLVLDEELKAELDELRHLLSHQNPDLSYLGVIRILAKKSLKQLKGKDVDAGKSPKGKISPKPGSDSELGNGTIPSGTESYIQPSENGVHSSSSRTETSSRTSDVGSKQVRQPNLLETRHRNEGKESTSPHFDHVKPHQKVSSPLPTTRTRYIPAQIRRDVLQRDQHSCQYTDPRTGKRCGSRAFPQLDHIQRVRHFGESNAQNLRVLCAGHNRMRG